MGGSALYIIQAANQYFEEKTNKHIKLALSYKPRLYKTRNVALIAIQSPSTLTDPQVSPIHLQMLADLKDQDMGNRTVLHLRERKKVLPCL